MLSSPSRNLQARQRATHRRQNSTPSAFEPAKIPALPTVQNRQRALGHRRGLSLDTRRQHLSPASAAAATTTTPTRQDFAMVSNTNNTASPQHVLREAQQQRILARPGPHQQNLSRSHTRHLSHHHQQQQQHPLRRQQHQQQNFMAAANDHDNGYVMSPHGTPQHQRFGAACFDNSSSPVPFNPYQGGGINVMMPMKDDPAFVGAMMNDKDFDLFGANADLSSPAFMDFNESPTSAQPIWAPEGDAAAATLRRTTRRISNGILDRVAKFETMGGEPSRPITPPHQNGNGQFLPTRLCSDETASLTHGPGYFPPTPMETPHDRIVKQQPEQASRPSRFSDDYDESMEETLKPVRGKPTSRAQNVFEEMRRRAEESSANPTPPQTTTMPEAQTFESQVSAADFITMNSFDTDYLKTQSFDGLTDDLGVSPGMSQNSAPHTPHSAVMNNGYHPGPFDNPDLRLPHHDSPATPSLSRTQSLRGTPHRRTDSLASIVSAASISGINIEETKTETGVTTDDIAIYIQGPDPADNKWMCLFEDCGKKFGRKENIKSHVQTHLNDRQYQCPSCHKCFVRQHDLKRHAKIHTGIKPYPCECGNSFARHDALTRHRQRGMCIGAFDGIVKKVVKRGRPRKHRPEMDERVNKSARTRSKNQSISSISSQSGYSDTSGANSPENYNPISDNDFAAMTMDIKQEQQHARHARPMPFETVSMSSAPMSSAPMPSPPPARASPLHHHENDLDVAPSPSVASHVSSFVSPEEIMDHPSVHSHHDASPTKSTPSQYNTPPELSQSSSPPPHHFFDAEPGSVSFADDSLLAGMRTSSAGGLGSAGNLSGLGLGDHDEELLMKAFDDNLGAFDRDPNVLMMSDFDDAVDMFTNGDDVFFGTS
ncbi:hypothetical protein BN1708_009733, partial [Verticillium longisporum]